MAPLAFPHISAFILFSHTAEQMIAPMRRGVPPEIYIAGEIGLKQMRFKHGARIFASPYNPGAKRMTVELVETFPDVSMVHPNVECFQPDESSAPEIVLAMKAIRRIKMGAWAQSDSSANLLKDADPAAPPREKSRPSHRHLTVVSFHTSCVLICSSFSLTHPMLSICHPLSFPHISPAPLAPPPPPPPPPPPLQADE